MDLFEQYLTRKQNGEKMNFSEIPKGDLNLILCDLEISDEEIAKLFNIKVKVVTEKRLNFRVDALATDLRENAIPEMYNDKCKSDLIKKENLDKVSKAITHFAFRNGPIEDMHANNQVSNNDMKTLNKFMVNRIAYIFSLIVEKRWFELEFLVDYHDEHYGQDWNQAIPDDGDIPKLLKWNLQNVSNYVNNI